MEETRIPDGVTVNAALLFAAEAHGKQTRGDEPYLVHLLECVAILEDEFHVTDEVTLLGAACHDILEDTVRTRDDLSAFVGPVVTGVVEEATDDMTLNSCEKKAKKLTLARAGHYSYRARLVMLADKLSNVRSLAKLKVLPPGWSEEEVRGYMMWCGAIGRAFVETNNFVVEQVRLLIHMHDKLADEVYKYTGVRVGTTEAETMIIAYLNSVKASD